MTNLVRFKCGPELPDPNGNLVAYSDYEKLFQAFSEARMLMQWFVGRVENWEARSTWTYDTYKAFLNDTERLGTLEKAEGEVTQR